jgi:hypothetical protein
VAACVQLRPHTMWQNAEKAGYTVSLLETLAERPGTQEYHNMMTTQYRMHPRMASIVSDTFYGGQLETARDVARARKAVAPIVFIDVPGKESSQSHSFHNPAEVQMVVQVAPHPLPSATGDWAVRFQRPPWPCATQSCMHTMSHLHHAGAGNHACRGVCASIHEYAPTTDRPPRMQELRAALNSLGRRCWQVLKFALREMRPVRSIRRTGETAVDTQAGLPPEPPKIDVLAFYKPQVNALQATLQKQGLLVDGVDVTTVDAMQGREADVIILSCVRSGCKGTLGFIRNPNRLNVAISRAREKLYFVGNRSAINELGSPEWQAIMQHENMKFWSFCDPA